MSDEQEREEAAAGEPREQRHADTEQIRARGLAPKCARDCEGRLASTTSCSRPGEVDITIRCDACAAARHLVLDLEGQVLADSLNPKADRLAAHRASAAPNKE